MREHDVYTVAALSWGLPDDSRCKMAAGKQRVPLDTQLLAIIADRVAQFAYMFANENRREQPASLYDAITGRGEEPEREQGDHSVGFDSIDEYLERRQKIIKGGGDDA